MSSNKPPQSGNRVNDEEDEDETQAAEANHLTADQVRESTQLNKLNDDRPETSADAQLALEAKLFVQLEAQEVARKLESERELNSIKISPPMTDFFMKLMNYDKQDAERILKTHKGDLQAALISSVKSFPQLKICRSYSNVLGP